MKKIYIIPFGLVALLLIGLIAACNKKADQIGLGLQPASQELSVVFDNNSGLIAYSIREDSVRTDANAIKTGMVGSMLDPVFGRTDAQIYSQFRLSENGHNFGEGAQLDSMVLSLAYSSFYGDTMTQQTVRVYELDVDMDPDTSYYSNQGLSDYGIEIAAITFMPGPSDTIYIDSVAQQPQLRIPLSSDFAQKLIDAGDAVYDDNESWLEFMKGLRITADQVGGNGGIMLFDMLEAATVMTIYYRSADNEDTLSFEFLSNSNCARFTAFDHNDYLEASAGLKAQIIDGDTSGGKDIFYLQAMGGVKAQLRLPDIQDYFADGPVSINEAKLIFKIYDDGSDLAAPPQLGLAMVDEDGDYLPVADANEVSSYYGGFLSENEDSYFFRISQHVQQVLTGATPNYPLVLLVQGASFRANRIILNGPEAAMNVDDRMILEVIYTKVN
ncbi:MAG: DUF4270 domain-containing protein [Bacteroidales bacterium]|nr:DUF4270 domain-containing protein [Bacteroidales bacterium]